MRTLNDPFSEFTMKNEQELLARITVNANVLLSKPTIRGTRLSVEHLLKALASRLSFGNLKDDYPFLEPDDISACSLYAAQRIEEEKVCSVAA